MTKRDMVKRDMTKRSAIQRKSKSVPSQTTKPRRPPAKSADVIRLPGADFTSLRDAAYEALKHRIITCVFKPGEYINEAYVSATLGIGRTPVHQAINRLMLEGMLSVMPRKGAIVRPASLDEIIQIIEVRLLNECHCVRLAADRADHADISELTDILGRGRQWIAARNIEQLMLVDKEFHSVLARASKNPVLGEVLLKLHERSLRFWFLSLNRPGHHEGVQRQHEDILAAIRNRDPKGAEQAMKAHIEAFRKNLIDVEH